MKNVLAFGEVLWDLLSTGAVLGGAPANFATRVQYLGVPVTFVSRVGKDDLGDQARAKLQSIGLDLSHVGQDDAYPTGTVEVTVDESGSASYNILTGVAYDYVASTPSLLEAASKSTLVYFGTLAQRNPASRKALQDILAAAPNATKLLDVNLRRECFTRDTVEASMQAADILKLNEVEVLDIAALLDLGVNEMEAFCDAIIERYDMELVLVTRGAQGAFAKSRTGEKHQVPGYSVKVVDTIGSGDAFTAGFVWSYIQGKPLRESCETGTRLGAMVATQRGGMVPISVDELKAFGNGK